MEKILTILNKDRISHSAKTSHSGAEGKGRLSNTDAVFI